MYTYGSIGYSSQYSIQVIDMVTKVEYAKTPLALLTYEETGKPRLHSDSEKNISVCFPHMVMKLNSLMWLGRAELLCVII